MEKANLTIICLDSSDDEVDEAVRSSVIRQSSNFKQTNEPTSSIHRSQSPNINQTFELQTNQKRLSNDGVENARKEVKRVKLTTISTCVSSKSKSNEEDFEHGLLTSFRAVECYDDLHENNNQNAIDEKQQPTSTTNIVEKPITKSIARLIDVCRKADPSDDMETVLNNKLLKYYHMVHSDFINSESFEKLVISMTKEIQSNNAFLKLGKVLKALNNQKKKVETNVNEDPVSTDDQREVNRVNHLLANLHKLCKRISELEATEVDLDDQNHLLELHSLCVQKKQRACETYKKICKITDGLAEVMSKKPIKFKETKYPQFNKKLQALVNQTDDCPDRTDVIRILKTTNEKYKLKLGEDEIARISEDAFISISKKLRKRRKHDLYETISCYATEKDPAIDDPKLKAELEKNRKYHSRINDVINRYAAMQDTCSDTNDATTAFTSNVHSDSDDDDDDDDDDDASQNDKGDNNEIIEIISDSD